VEIGIRTTGTRCEEFDPSRPSHVRTRGLRPDRQYSHLRGSWADRPPPQPRHLLPCSRLGSGLHRATFLTATHRRRRVGARHGAGRVSRSATSSPCASICPTLRCWVAISRRTGTGRSSSSSGRAISGVYMAARRSIRGRWDRRAPVLVCCTDTGEACRGPGRLGLTRHRQASRWATGGRRSADGQFARRRGRDRDRRWWGRWAKDCAAHRPGRHMIGMPVPPSRSAGTRGTGQQGHTRSWQLSSTARAEQLVGFRRRR